MCRINNCSLPSTPFEPHLTGSLLDQYSNSKTQTYVKAKEILEIKVLAFTTTFVYFTAVKFFQSITSTKTQIQYFSSLSKCVCIREKEMRGTDILRKYKGEGTGSKMHSMPQHNCLLNTVNQSHDLRITLELNQGNYSHEQKNNIRSQIYILLQNQSLKGILYIY